jgi:hypothetical protein
VGKRSRNLRRTLASAHEPCAAPPETPGLASEVLCAARDRADGYRSALRNFLQALSDLTMELWDTHGARHPLYSCCSTHDVREPAMAIEYGPDHPSDLRDGMLQHNSEDSIPPRNTLPFAL